MNVKDEERVYFIAREWERMFRLIELGPKIVTICGFPEKSTPNGVQHDPMVNDVLPIIHEHLRQRIATLEAQLRELGVDVPDPAANADG